MNKIINDKGESFWRCETGEMGVFLLSKMYGLHPFDIYKNDGNLNKNVYSISYETLDYYNKEKEKDNQERGESYDKCKSRKDSGRDLYVEEITYNMLKKMFPMPQFGVSWNRGKGDKGTDIIIINPKEFIELKIEVKQREATTEFKSNQGFLLNHLVNGNYESSGSGFPFQFTKSDLIISFETWDENKSKKDSLMHIFQLQGACFNIKREELGLDGKPFPEEYKKRTEEYKKYLLKAKTEEEKKELSKKYNKIKPYINYSKHPIDLKDWKEIYEYLCEKLNVLPKGLIPINQTITKLL